MKAIVIAGTVSGVGKTTISTGLMGALARRKLKVQPFKAGPDYIDPTYHCWAAGVPSRNLDTWMLSHRAVIELFARAMRGKDIAVIEGVMGLFDGRSPTNDEGSTAEVAKLLGAPVILIVDCSNAARSTAAMVAGYKNFDPALRLAGVILNNIGSEGHLRSCQEGIEHYTGVKVLGHMPRRNDLVMPERHLGLIPIVEGQMCDDFLGRLIAQVESTIDIPEILRLAEEAKVPEPVPVLFPPASEKPVVRIAVARDKAFSFYYEDSLDLLEAWGAGLVSFSPLEDAVLPADIYGLYIGGGFPELYAGDLAGNAQMKRKIKLAIDRGMPVYAECGGLMYLGESIRDFQGKRHPMVGAIPVSCRIDSPRLSLGYRTVRALDDGPLLRCGETVRGHEFHWSIADSSSEMNAYQIEGQNRREGFHLGNVFASYVHLHMGSAAGMAQRFIEVCWDFRQMSGPSGSRV